MKYIKKFERSEHDYTFKEGDIVVCIDNEGNEDLIEGEKYEVISFYINANDTKFIKITGKSQVSGYFSNRFIPELEYDAQKYNI